jgi:hypothetical protein
MGIKHMRPLSTLIVLFVLAAAGCSTSSDPATTVHRERL